ASSAKSDDKPGDAPEATSNTTEERGRYLYETPISETRISLLSRAVDNHLNRSVVLERFREGHTESAMERRLLAFAGAGGPYLQRVLGYDRQNRIAVFEAPAGTRMCDVATVTTPEMAIGLLKNLARAVGTLHSRGHAHGAISNST